MPVHRRIRWTLQAVIAIPTIVWLLPHPLLRERVTDVMVQVRRRTFLACACHFVPADSANDLVSKPICVCRARLAVDEIFVEVQYAFAL